MIFPLIICTFFFFSQAEINPPESFVSWNEIEHDFGIIEHKKPVKTTFVFTNNTTDSIKLEMFVQLVGVLRQFGPTNMLWLEIPVIS